MAGRGLFPRSGPAPDIAAQIERDHQHLKGRLGTTRGFKTLAGARVHGLTTNRDLLVRTLRAHGTQRIVGTVLKENSRMRLLAKRLGFAETPSDDDPGLVHIELPLHTTGAQEP